MPIRIRGTTAQRVGKVAVQLGALTDSMVGTNVPPASRNGRVLSQLGAVGVSIRGQFAVPAGRNGKLGLAPSGLASAIRGTTGTATSTPQWTNSPVA